MARSLSQCNFIGNLGNDPDVRYLPDGWAVANISIAVSDDYKDKNGQKVEQTEWVRVNFFGKQAEVVGQYLKKGSKIFVSGKMKTRKWQDQSGQDKYSTEIVASDMQMLDSRGSADAVVTEPGGAQAPKAATNSESQPGGFSDFDDDIPFTGGFSDFDDDIPFNRIGREHFA